MDRVPTVTRRCEIEVFEDPATVVLVTRDGAVFKDRIGSGESLLAET